MATVRYFIKGSQVRVRYRNGRAVDLEAGTGIFLDPKYWDKANEKIKNVIAVPDRDSLNVKLFELKARIISQASIDFFAGVTYNSAWLKGIIAKYANRPGGVLSHQVEGYKVFLSDFMAWWLKEKAPTHKVSATKYLDTKGINGYKYTMENLQEYEKAKKVRVRLQDVEGSFLDAFSTYLTAVPYSSGTVTVRINAVKFFCNRAVEEGLNVNPAYNKVTVFVQKKREDFYVRPYLNWDEIQQVYDLDLTGEEALDNARDNFIIGLCTGLRVSDFLTYIKEENIRSGMIYNTNRKTGADVVIPMHPLVKGVLDKRNGMLPKKITPEGFNMHIKTIAERCGFNEVMKGGIVMKDDETQVKGKVVGTYQKWQLVTSHICRRSFATNNFKLISKKALMSICGWKKEQQMLDYIKLSGVQYAEELAVAWKRDDLKAA